MYAKRCLALAALCSVVGLAACGGSSSTTPVLGPDGQPTGQVVQQQQSSNGWLWGLGGYLLGRMGSGGGGHSTYYGAPPTSHTTVNRTVIVNKTINNHAAPTRPPVVQTPNVVTPPKASYVKPPTVSTSPRTWTPSYSSRSSSGFSSSRGGRR